MAIIVNEPAVRADLNQYIARLESLASHLRVLAAGGMPSPAEVASAPLLEFYSFCHRPAECIQGYVSGHPTLEGPMTTSEVWTASPEHGWARTLSRLYRLGQPRDSARFRH